jgi:hypothetical protein
MEKKASTRTLHDRLTAVHFREAEKLIIAGIIARLIEHCKAEFKNDSAMAAAAVARKIFNIPGHEDLKNPFSPDSGADLDSLIVSLRSDREICGILTQAFTMRIVQASRLSGCKTEDLYGDINRLKELGLYLEDGPPPTPSSFIKRAEAFFHASPKSQGRDLSEV